LPRFDRCLMSTSPAACLCAIFKGTSLRD
jgi:hypothetical protein